jgi:hypothetical protein
VHISTAGSRGSMASTAPQLRWPSNSPALHFGSVLDETVEVQYELQ